MIKAPIKLQDLRRRLYVKAKAEPTWRFWGLYVHVCKRETLWEAYQLAKQNNGAPGVDGVTFQRSWPVAASNRASRSRAAIVTRVRLVRAPSISLPASSLATRSTDGSSRSHCANHLEASSANRGTAAGIREKQWPDHWSDRSRRTKCISARPKKAWLNRLKVAAHFRFKFLIGLIAGSSQSSRRLTRF